MLSKLNISFNVIIILLLCGTNLTCQEFPPEEYRLKYFGTKDGLSSRIAYNSVADTTGVIWSGTTGGLCRINGYGVTGLHQIPMTFRGEVHYDAKGWLYVINRSFHDSVEVINPATLEVWGDRFNDKSRGVFGGIYQRNGSALYFAQGGIIYAYLPGEELRQIHLISQEILSGDQLIAASDDSYLLYRKETQTIEQFHNGEFSVLKLPTDSPPDCLYLDQSDYLWVSSPEGTFRRPMGGSFSLFLGPLENGGSINFFAEDENHNMFFGYMDPLLIRVTYLEQIIDGVRSEAKWLTGIEDRILSISGKDYRKTIRLNTYGGIYALDFNDPVKSPFKKYLSHDILPGKFGDVMRGFTADDEGRIYTNKDSSMPYWFRLNPESDEMDTLIILDNEGLAVDQLGCGTNLINYKGDIYGHTCGLDSNGLFLGSLYRYNPRSDEWKSWPLPEASQVIRWIAKGRTEDEFLLITEEKVNHEDGQLYYFYPAQDSFAYIQPAGPALAVEGYTKGAAFDEKRNCLWFGTDRAFYRFDFEDHKLHSYFLGGDKETFISDVLLRKNGMLLLSALKEGLQSFDPSSGRFTKVGGLVPVNQQPANPEVFLELPTNDVATLNLTEENDLLLTTFEGLALHGSRTGETTVFTTNDGLGSDEFNTSSVFFHAAGKRWYAGGVNGFVSFSIADLTPPVSPYNPVFLSYRIFDKGIGYETTHILPSAPAHEITFSPSVLYFEIDFTIPDYFPQGHRKYQTKLEGLDIDWSSPTTSNSVRYTGLDPGKYTLHVRAFDGQGRKGEIERSINIVVLKPFYKQWWFGFLMVLTCLLLLYCMHRIRLYRLREKMERERKMQSLELRSLRQQLNPHFISNAMNAIKEYIQRPDANDPARYLTDFSLMMRRFLESSRHRFTSIADEVDMLERYISLEQLRFPGKFNVNVRIDPKLDPQMDEVPSLFLQPIIENAIQHGLGPLKSGGELIIDFSLDPTDDDVIICVISDNGVGRSNAEMLPKRFNHVSRATAILEERQALLATNDEIKIGIEVSDLYPGKKYPGTVVTIRIEAC
ncbi:hypothetical protein FUA23_09475 [Neolewinella aurantiaca]|uniref:Signal transduction histidine kinase internal region domain-containing protein n=1 Tax=Neolewinella aurantiaca TaxID=2602767 RepID=A0A5C7FTS9_9BACT|nr:histidine kinase [Neolewinella aurantiaca]TXF89670.1 hypothetical protein FUA23_09475 [Neolewinella aurantiaca]